MGNLYYFILIVMENVIDSFSFFFSPGIVFSLMTTLNHLDLMNAHSNLTITSFAVSVTSLETDPLVVDAAWVALWLEVDMGVAFVRDA